MVPIHDQTTAAIAGRHNQFQHEVRLQADALEMQNEQLTDATIAQLAQAALDSSRFPQLRNLKAYCDHGRITLQGRLPTWYLKQVAHECVLSVSGVRDVDNDVKVHAGTFSPSTSRAPR